MLMQKEMIKLICKIETLKKIAEKYPTLTILEFIETYKGVIK